jgi:phospholipase C
LFSPRSPHQWRTPSAIDRLIANGTMSGLVASAAATLATGGVEDGDPGCVMGYYDGADLPVYDHLAEQFAVCDRWFASVAGATLPNRLYALSGAAAGSPDDRPSHVPSLYHKRSFVRHLDAGDISWRWYSPDPGCCCWPTPATGWATMTGSVTSARRAVTRLESASASTGRKW